MSPHAPPHLKHIAPNLMAGEDVRWMSTPDRVLLAYLEAAVFVVSGLIFWVLFAIFSGLPIHLTVSSAIVAAAATVGILHVTIGMRTYVITDHRLLVFNPFTHDIHDSCELDDIGEITNPRFSRSLMVHRRNGNKPIRLWAVRDLATVQQSLAETSSSEAPDSNGQSAG